jgi:alpha-L-arabinofuranosidase
VRQSLYSAGKDVRPIYNLPILDAVVLRDSTDGSLSIGLINRDLEQQRSIRIQLEDVEPRNAATQFLSWDEGAIKNTDEREEDTRVLERSINASKSFEVQLPPHSVSLIKLTAK